ncbi:unnamed protein product [Toxocara canis]|uniref:non-specific serine/threonine protein kinase n=1 Tax=Toxocara canis TaxID=6265 RepID=A0A3P7H2P1_TOXCA|nr:unnamed protein product [Toxocara canis]
MRDRDLKLREVQKHELLPKHPNLVEFICAWEEEGRLFIQTELCEYSGFCFKSCGLFGKGAQHPRRELWFWLADLVAAVNHLHSHDLLHLDIKPENIFVSRDQVCKLGDFGLIVDLKKDVLIAHEEGDSKYLAPETLNSPPSKPADIFSLGISILELATDLDLPSRGDGWRMLREGNIPEVFTRSKFSCIFLNTLTVEPDRLKTDKLVGILEFTVQLSPKLVHLIYWMMEPDPDKRPTAQQLLNDASVQHYLALRCKQRPAQMVSFP